MTTLLAIHEFSGLLRGAAAQFCITETAPDPTLKRALDNITKLPLVHVPGLLPAIPPLPAPQANDEDVSVLDVLKKLVEQNLPGKITLDVIAHAHDGEIQLGTCSISDVNKKLSNLADQLTANQIRLSQFIEKIRLLGCLTAETDAGRAAIRTIKKLTGVPVWGTTTLISAEDFGRTGFHSPQSLIESDQMQAARGAPWMAKGELGAALPPSSAELLDKPRAWFLERPTASFNAQLLGVDDNGRSAVPDVIGHLLESLQAETAEQARRDMNAHPTGDASRPRRWDVVAAPPNGPSLADLLQSCEPEVRIVEGLLLLPDVEVLYPAPAAPDGTPRFFRVTHLLGGHLIRVYPGDSYPVGALLLTKGAPLPAPG
ncbi:MAG TPA: DUF4347 domain-containing protein [Kofleriaceae bacterium]|nr:DUF4347 domain-containing protein [Kofleriaceae bacterium]